VFLADAITAEKCREAAKSRMCVQIKFKVVSFSTLAKHTRTSKLV
jgi:hypothetical protein